MITETHDQAVKRMTQEHSLPLEFWISHDIERCSCKKDCSEWIIVKKSEIKPGK